MICLIYNETDQEQQLFSTLAKLFPVIFSDATLYCAHMGSVPDTAVQYSCLAGSIRSHLIENYTGIGGIKRNPMSFLVSKLPGTEATQSAEIRAHGNKYLRYAFCVCIKKEIQSSGFV